MNEVAVFAAKKVFSLTDEQVENNSEFLSQIPAAIVDYENKLPGESKANYDKRRETIEAVGDGDPKKLSQLLKKLNIKSINKGASSWETVFEIYKRFVNPSLDGLDRGNAVSSTEVVSEPKVAEPSPAIQEKEDTSNSESNRETSNAESDTKKQLNSETTGDVSVKEPTPAVQTQEQVTAPSVTTVNIKETLIMSDVTKKDDVLSEIINQISDGTGTGVPSTSGAGATGKTSGAAKIKPNSELATLIERSYQESFSQRYAATKQDHITREIVQSLSIKERLVVADNIRGALITPSTKGEPDEIAKKNVEAITKKLNDHARKMAGHPEYKVEPGKTKKIFLFTYEDWKKLTDEEKYAAVDPRYVEVAKEVMADLEKALSNPTEEFNLKTPDAPAYNLKGIEITRQDGTKEYLNRADICGVIAERYLDRVWGENMLGDDANAKPEFYDADGKHLDRSRAVFAEIKTVNNNTNTRAGGFVSDKKKVFSASLCGRKALESAGKLLFIFNGKDELTAKTQLYVVPSKEYVIQNDQEAKTLTELKYRYKLYELVAVDGTTANGAAVDTTKRENFKVKMSKGNKNKAAVEVFGFAGLKGVAEVYKPISEINEVLTKDTVDAANRSYWGLPVRSQSKGELLGIPATAKDARSINILALATDVAINNVDMKVESSLFKLIAQTAEGIAQKKEFVSGSSDDDPTV